MADDDEPMFSLRRPSAPRRPSPPPQPKQQAKENDMQFDVEEPMHQVEEQDVDGNAQEPLHQSELRQAAKDTDVATKDTDLAAATSVAAKDTDVATALLLTDLAAATSIGTTTATSVGDTELLAAMSIAAKDTDVSTTLVPAIDVSTTTDDRTGDGQNQIYIENLWKNWDPDSEPDPSQPSKIPEELTNYVWGLNPEWGIEWWNVRHMSSIPVAFLLRFCHNHGRCSKDIYIWFPITLNDYIWIYQVLAVCLVARSHWVLAHINLEDGPLRYMTPWRTKHKKIPAIVWPASRA
ncbi:hypothetical protein Dimus_005951 [Dionaea muscipula]